MSQVVYLSVLVIAAAMPSALAVCLDPKTLVSGYQVPFGEELESSTAVVVGEITAQESVNEDPSDPEGLAAYIYTVEVSRQLKGNLPQTIRIRVEADSGGYRMAVGEQHVLFLQSEESHLVANDCGNSSQLPEGN